MPFFPKDPSVTQEALARQAKGDFEKRGRDPRAWQAYALSLRESARLLWDHTDAAPDDASRADRLGLVPVAMMLAGLGIEVLAKGLLVHGNPRPVVDGKWKGGQHDLVSLVTRTGLAIEPKEREVLSQLSGFVKFAGRYPIPTKSEHLTPRLEAVEKGKWPTIELAPGTFISIDARAVFETLFTRLNQYLEQKMS